jgi:transmembrane sensor
VEEKFKHIEDIIAKFLSGEATPDEIRTLEEWKARNKENALEYSQFVKLFNMTSMLSGEVNVNTDVAWKKIKASLNNQPPGKVVQLNRYKNSAVFLRIAAVIILAAGLAISVFFLFRNDEKNFAHFDSGNSIKEFSLPDGSHLTLNKNSTITFEQNSFSKRRIVKLKGEAFFIVKHDSLSPFVVETNNLHIHDIGTAFNVNQHQDFVIVSVSEGKVELTTSGNNSVMLSAGEEASFRIKTQTIEKESHIGENVTAYRDKIFVFDNVELGKIVNVLNEIYDVKLELENPNLNHCRITVSFNNESIEDIAGVISETLGLKQRNDNGKIILQGDDCK